MAPPSKAGATLSGWPSNIVACLSISFGDKLRSASMLAIVKPANKAADEEPRPLAKGISDFTTRRCGCMLLVNVSAACTIKWVISCGKSGSS